MSTPFIKFEHSPADGLADSFVSTPGTQYPSLFDNTMDPTEVMTPKSFNDDSIFGGSVDGSMAGTPAPEKKPLKKRKSWGQQLPEPKTSLPPRKRAKTEDEKEQRRVERVLRNRRAAQSSRERKRQEVEALEAEKRAIERRNQDLEMRLADLEAKNIMLQNQLEQFTGSMAVFRGNSVASSPRQTEQFQRTPSPVTFSQELFGSRDALHRSSISQQSIADSEPSQTVNPASLSPEIRPVGESSNASSSNMTQHPAAMLCDLQCQLEEQRPWTYSATTATTSQVLTIIMCLSLTLTSTSMLLIPLSQIVTSLKTGSSLSPTSSVLTMIIWLVTTTASLTNSTSMNTFTTTKTSPRPKFSLRICLLNRLLSCSPNLARPLMDATMAAMRLQSEQQLTRDCLTGVGARDSCDEGNSPTLEALMTLLWAVQVFEKNLERTPQLDAATETRQELDSGLFRLRKINDTRGVSLVSGRSRIMKGKSPEGWRTAFNHDRP